MKRKSFKIVAVFSIVVFLIMSVTMFLIAGIAIFMNRSGLFVKADRGFLLPVLAGISVLISTVIARVFSNRFLSPIIEISEATKEVAKGNFELLLPEDSQVREVLEMERNFNIMTQELAGIETFRSDFVSNVSHEFKTPLSAIEGYATLLQNKALSDEKREAYLAKIIASTRRLSSLTGNILQITRLENQEITPTMKVYSLDEQLRETILLFEEQWSEKEIDLDIRLDSVNYCGSRELLGQVWQNIFENAVKFVPQGGTIGVTLEQSEKSVTVTIADSGIGMSNAVKKRIFEKFYQGDKSHSSAGNGLGLTLVKRIVDLCDGTIAVTSEEGKGAVFTVTLPR